MMPEPWVSRFGKILARERIVASTGFNRWLVPPCALAIHLCIGMAYGFSVFWLPMSRLIGGDKPALCEGMTLGRALTTTTCDWRVSDLTWTYSLFFVVLGIAAAVGGGWLERAGPRKAGVAAACCWAGGIAVGALGVAVHQLWLVWLGTGVIGGIGLGLGYISPVSTLIRWFPDRLGVASGMAIMGFGGGAMIGSPLADLLMQHFASPHSAGVWQTLLVLAGIYFTFMMSGALGFRVSPPNFAPAGWTGASASSAFSVHVHDAHKTPQFWLLWLVLLVNVSASIGIIGVASPMIQEIFGGRLIGHPELSFLRLDDAQRKAAAAVGTGFVGLISLFNIGGRFFWSALSDRIGRKAMHAVILALGVTLYALVAPATAANAELLLFALTFAVIASIFGGGFAAAPAYLADLFGTQYVGAINGRLLTAWSTAGVLGVIVVNTVHTANLRIGAVGAGSYTPIFLWLSGLLALGFCANLMVRPVAEKWRCQQAPIIAQIVAAAAPPAPRQRLALGAACAWAAVLGPLAWGFCVTVSKAKVLFS